MERKKKAKKALGPKGDQKGETAESKKGMGRATSAPFPSLLLCLPPSLSPLSSLPPLLPSLFSFFFFLPLPICIREGEEERKMKNET
jgi:hypothetical protein